MIRDPIRCKSIQRQKDVARSLCKPQTVDLDVHYTHTGLVVAGAGAGSHIPH